MRQILNNLTSEVVKESELLGNLVVTQHKYSQLCVRCLVKTHWHLCFKVLLAIKPCQHGKGSREQGKTALCEQEDQEELCAQCGWFQVRNLEQKLRQLLRGFIMRPYFL